MSHCISHHIFHTPHHTRYALNCILHDTIPHYIITFCTSQLHFTPHSHIPHQFPYLTPNLNCNIPQCTSYYTFELHNSASCTIPRHSTVYFTSQHSVFHITPPQLFSITAHSTAHIHILHYTYRATHLTSLTDCIIYHAYSAPHPTSHNYTTFHTIQILHITVAFHITSNTSISCTPTSHHVSYYTNTHHIPQQTTTFDNTLFITYHTNAFHMLSHTLQLIPHFTSQLHSTLHSHIPCLATFHITLLHDPATSISNVTHCTTCCTSQLHSTPHRHYPVFVGTNTKVLS